MRKVLLAAALVFALVGTSGAAQAQSVLTVSVAKRKLRASDPERETIRWCHRVSASHVRCGVTSYIVGDYEEVDPETGETIGQQPGVLRVPIPLIADVTPRHVHWSFP